MGRRNRLNEFMPMDVIVTAQAQSSRTMLRESGMSGAVRSSQLCQIDAEIATERRKKFAVAGEDWKTRRGRSGKEYAAWDKLTEQLFMRRK
jgi:UDP-glucose 4-epimerase